MMSFFDNLLEISLDAAPWLLLGFLAAGWIKVWIPSDTLNRWLGGRGIWPVTKAALIGTPLPLCSCGVLPAALGLRRSGASKSSTISFLIATPETGVDSIALSYALLGPFMTIVRPIAAVISAIFSGLLTSYIPEAKENTSTCTDNSCGCSSTGIDIPVETEACIDNCCSGEIKTEEGFIARTLSGVRYGLVDMVDDLVLWLALGLVLAALVTTMIPPMTMAEWGSGLPAMLMMLVVGIPMYICATASTPVAAALLFAGISPGTVLVFLLAGPATNIATMGIIRKEMGQPVLFAYLIGISLSSIILGIATDWLIDLQGINIQAQISDGSEWLPKWVVYLSGLILLTASIKSLTQKIRKL